MTQPRTKTVADQETPQNQADYIELRLPKIGPLKSMLAYAVFLILLLFAFLLGIAVDRFLGGTLTATATTTSLPPQTTAAGAFVAYAKQLGLNTQSFQSCLASGKYDNNIATDINEGSSASVSATPSFFINGVPIVGAQPYSDFQAIINQQLTNNKTSDNLLTLIQPAYAQEVNTDTPSPASVMQVGSGHFPVLGNANAPVTVIEFSDFQCPFCESFFKNTFPSLKKDYIDTGKVKFYYRQFPLTSIHPNAQEAAEAAECANEQNKFWQYHDMLFQQQSSWESLPTDAIPS